VGRRSHPQSQPSHTIAITQADFRENFSNSFVLKGPDSNACKKLEEFPKALRPLGSLEIEADLEGSAHRCVSTCMLVCKCVGVGWRVEYVCSCAKCTYVEVWGAKCVCICAQACVFVSISMCI
jgi:hypothetical protein